MQFYLYNYYVNILSYNINSDHLKYIKAMTYKNQREFSFTITKINIKLIKFSCR
jgi:hypothetical protein